MAASLIRITFLMAWLSACGVAGAFEFLPDPTRPAVDLSPEKNKAGAGGVAGEIEPVVIKEVLQSVIISPQYRAAVISGERVMLGDKFRGSTLIDVLESSVVLNDARGKRVLQLFPNISLHKIVPVAAQVVNEPVANEQPVPIEKKKQATKASKKPNTPVAKGKEHNTPEAKGEKQD